MLAETAEFQTEAEGRECMHEALLNQGFCQLAVLPVHQLDRSSAGRCDLRSNAISAPLGTSWCFRRSRAAWVTMRCTTPKARTVRRLLWLSNT